MSLGFTSVMYDGSRLDDATNRRGPPARSWSGVTPRGSVWRPSSVRWVARTGPRPSARTDPEAAAAFVAETGVDAFAVAVGSSHAMTSRTAELDLDLVARLREAVPVPLVLHGSSGVPDDVIVAAVRAGMRKVNIATHLNAVFTAATKDYLESHPRRGHPPVPGRQTRRRCARDGSTLELLALHEPEGGRSAPGAW